MGVKSNMGGLDRLIRLGLSIPLLALGLGHGEWLGIAWINQFMIAFALFNLGVVAVGVCPFYLLAHLNTKGGEPETLRHEP